MRAIVTFAEQRAGRLRRAALEAVSEARRLADTLKATVATVVVAPRAAGFASELASYGADRVHAFEDAESYATERYAGALAEVIAGAKPGAGLVSDCVALALSDGRLRARRPVYAGKAYATVAWEGDPQMATLRPNVFPLGTPEASRKAEVVAGTLSGSARARVTDTQASAAGKVELSEAQVIVSGGRGLRGPENFHLVTALGEAFGAAVGASRAVVDAGWVEHQMQVGQTGKTVSPTLYIACGISGAIQHLAGMSSSKCIVAINKDRDAPIFKVANYGIVGDVFEILPKLTAAAKAYFASKG